MVSYNITRRGKNYITLFEMGKSYRRIPEILLSMKNEFKQTIMTTIPFDNSQGNK